MKNVKNQNRKNQGLPFSECIKILGVILNEKLRFTNLVNYLPKKPT